MQSGFREKSLPTIAHFIIQFSIITGSLIPFVSRFLLFPFSFFLLSRVLLDFLSFRWSHCRIQSRSNHGDIRSERTRCPGSNPLYFEKSFRLLWRGKKEREAYSIQSMSFSSSSKRNWLPKFKDSFEVHFVCTTSTIFASTSISSTPVEVKDCIWNKLFCMFKNKIRYPHSSVKMYEILFFINSQNFHSDKSLLNLIFNYPV